MNRERRRQERVILVVREVRRLKRSDSQIWILGSEENNYGGLGNKEIFEVGVSSCRQEEKAGT